MLRVDAKQISKDSVTPGIEGHPEPAKPRPERIGETGTESGLQALSGYFITGEQ